MRVAFPSGLAVFSHLYTVVLAAGPIVRPNATSSSINLDTKALTSACAGSSPALCTLHVQNANVIVTLADLQYEPNRDESVIAQMMSSAIRGAVGRGHGPHEFMGTQHRRWAARSEAAVRSAWALDLSPSDSMTWAMWVDALVELEQFTQNCPQWDCVFSVMLDDDGQRKVVGTGSLGSTPWRRG